MAEITILQLQATDTDLIKQIAAWYLDEWGIKANTTISRLTNQPGDDILFQLILFKNNKVVATGGLYNNIGLLNDQPKFKKYKPWVALLYTDNENRNQGIGQRLLKKIEELANGMQLTNIYLYTYTAESLYKRNGWQQQERVNYKGHDTVVMEKEIYKHTP